MRSCSSLDVPLVEIGRGVAAERACNIDDCRACAASRNGEALACGYVRERADVGGGVRREGLNGELADALLGCPTEREQGGETLYGAVESDLLAEECHLASPLLENVRAA